MHQVNHANVGKDRVYIHNRVLRFTPPTSYLTDVLSLPTPDPKVTPDMQEPSQRVVKAVITHAFTTKLFVKPSISGSSDMKKGLFFTFWCIVTSDLGTLIGTALTSSFSASVATVEKINL